MGVKHRLAAALAVAAVVALCVSLGMWQMDRARQKSELRDAMRARAELPAIEVGAGLLAVDDMMSGPWRGLD